MGLALLFLEVPQSSTSMHEHVSQCDAEPVKSSSYKFQVPD